MAITIINGPNLNLLGKREPEIYGTQTFEDYFEQLKSQYPDCVLHYFQSNAEGAIIDHIHAIGFESEGIILNAGAYSHYSYAIADAIAAIPAKVIEVHISNIHARQEIFRHSSVITGCCVGMISGFGMESYRLALDYLLRQEKE